MCPKRRIFFTNHTNQHEQRQDLISQICALFQSGGKMYAQEFSWGSCRGKKHRDGARHFFLRHPSSMFLGIHLNCILKKWCRTLWSYYNNCCYYQYWDCHSFFLLKAQFYVQCALAFVNNLYSLLCAIIFEYYLVDIIKILRYIYRIN